MKVNAFEVLFNDYFGASGNALDYAWKVGRCSGSVDTKRYFVDKPLIHESVTVHPYVRSTRKTLMRNKR